MTEISLYPLRFEPIFQYRLWGGRRLDKWATTSLPGKGPIGEAWLLSDRDDHPSRVMDGPLKGRTISELIKTSPQLMLGKTLGKVRRFPLLLKLLDVQKMLSVQVHPADSDVSLLPEGETGKAEAWVVLEAEPGSRIYAGLKPGATSAALRALSHRTVEALLPSFGPSRGDVVHIKAGVVHSLGDGLLVFEVQESSDVTFRLYDWDHVDQITGRRRELQIEQALECIDVGQGAVVPTIPESETTHPFFRALLVDDPHFRMWRLQSAVPLSVGAEDAPRALFCIAGDACIEYGGSEFSVKKGNVVLLPAAVGVCRLRPGRPVTLLEIAVPVQA
jgi:mannose-6-phosphate isomerase